MKTAINKTLYKFAQHQIQKSIQKNINGGRIKNSALATRLYEEFHFGQFDLTKQWLTFSLTDILALTNEVQSSHGVDIRNDPYPSKEDRLATAETNRNEKENSYAVSKDFILINSLTDINVNQKCHKISPLTSLGIYIKAEEIKSIEHSAIVLVENLTVMANLNAINLASIKSNIDLSKALWLYRGDVKAQQTTNTSYQFFRRFKGHIPLVCFSDLDPKGIEIALTSDADYWLTVENKNEITMELSGNEQEWYKQGASISFLQKKISTIPDQEVARWQNVFENLRTYRKTLKQEHILKHNVALALLELN
ncbi:hypothetical protein A9Q75_04295 [Colwellia psychrerythraea]|uniref:DUF7281 domain-containing protein n=1 Tax=Colwellia psychrerythraea TaxID=28229 RepID=A0A1Y5EMS4_COLPS|nr:hypothetical protein A9Q75_04295 [Colwellia psychrerythraea]